MKAPLSLTFSILSCLQLVLILPSHAFDEPLYDHINFSADGVFIEGPEKESLLRALVAITSDFSGQSEVDEDLKEKALAIALNLDPLHYLSRATYRELMRSESPTPTSLFTSLSAVSETLWNSASRMLKAPSEPEEKKLAALLIDLSLVLHPDPPDERMLKLAEATGGKAIPWGDFVMLQPDTSNSSSRSDFFMEEGRALLRAEKLRAEKSKIAANTPPKPKPVKPALPVKGLPEFTPISRSLPVVVKVVAIDESFVAGNINLTIRNPKGDVERERFPYVGIGAPENYPAIPLLNDPDGIPIPGIKNLPNFLEGEALSWPVNTIGVFNFLTDDQLPGPRSQCSITAGPWIETMIKTTVQEININDQFAFSDASASSDEIGPLLDAAAKLEKPYFLIPESNFDALVDHMHTSNALEKLFTSEIITYADPKEAIQFFSSETPQALKEASAAFSEIKRASEKMSLSELSRYQSAQERLEAIINQFKNHGSARAMFEYGLRPASEKTKVMESLKAVTTAIEPFFTIEDEGVDSNALRGQLETSDLILSKMRTQIHPDVRDYHGQAEDLIELAELYLNLSNKGTSIATQRLSTILILINKIKSEKTSIEANYEP